MPLKTRRNNNIRKHTSQKKSKKHKRNTVRKTKNNNTKKIRKNKLKYGGVWNIPFLSGKNDDLKQVQEIELENERKQVEEIELENQRKQVEENEKKILEEEISNLALTKSIYDDKYNLNDVIEYALFTLGLYEKCTYNCKNKLCEKCDDLTSSQCDERVCNDFNMMMINRPSYVQANLCRQDFMKYYGGVPYHCAAYINMAATLNNVKKRFDKTDTIYKCLDYFSDTYKGHTRTNPEDKFKPEFIRNKLNELRTNLTQQNTSE